MPNLLVEITDAQERHPLREQELVVRTLRIFEGRSFGSRKSIYDAFSRTQEGPRISPVRFAGILDALIALGLVSVYSIHGRAEVYKLSDVGKWVLVTVREGKHLSQLLSMGMTRGHQR